MSSPGQSDGSGPRHFGVYPGVVTDIVDPEHLGRVQVRLPWLGEAGDREVRAWATLCTPYADEDQGLQVMPAVGSHVVLAFEAGNVQRPYVVGAAWHGQKQQPFRPERGNHLRTLRTRSGSRLEFDDTPGRAKVTVETAAGHRVVLDEGGGSVTVEHASGSVVRLTPARVTLDAAVVEVKGAQLTVDAATARFTGLVQCTSLVATGSITSPAYSPGVGNTQ